MTIARRFATFVMLLVGPVAGTAQSIPGAVLAKNEPHHHLVYEDSALRVLRVRVPAHDTTLLHEHDPDYFWIALGASTVVNAKLGAPDATITSRDLSIHYTLGKFAHVARNPGGVPFDNITVELLHSQTGVRNLCEPALADKPLDCPHSSERSGTFAGAMEHGAFATDRGRVSLLTVPANGSLRAPTGAGRTWLIVLDTADTKRIALSDDAGRWVGGVLHAPPTRAWTLQNRGRSPLRLLGVVER